MTISSVASCMILALSVLRSAAAQQENIELQRGVLQHIEFSCPTSSADYHDRLVFGFEGQPSWMTARASFLYGMAPQNEARQYRLTVSYRPRKGAWVGSKSYTMSFTDGIDKRKLAAQQLAASRERFSTSGKKLSSQIELPIEARISIETNEIGNYLVICPLNDMPPRSDSSIDKASPPSSAKSSVPFGNDCSCSEFANETKGYGQVVVVRQSTLEIGVSDSINIGNCTKSIYCTGQDKFTKYDFVNYTKCTTEDGSAWLKTIQCV